MDRFKKNSNFVQKYYSYLLKMPNIIAYNSLFESFKQSLIDGTFAKLTLAKTIGNTQLMNIYVRTIVEENVLKVTLKYKFQQEEITEIRDIDKALPILVSYMNNPFLSMLLFTTNSDITVKLNKKRVASISEKQATFKNADPILIEYLNSK
jgi:CRISPR/Cas system CMR-associated protein Cmr5 small subunit